MILMGVTMFMSGMLTLISSRKHVLNMLLSLEFIVLSLIWILTSCLCFIIFSYYFLLFFLVFTACEGALGLSLIVLMIRSYGSDLVLNLNLT